MADTFNRVSLAVRLSPDYFPFKILYLEAASYFNKPILRVLFHEITHFWQTLSMNYVTKVAEEEWRRLREFEKKKVISKRSGILKDIYEVDRSIGFSPHILLESLARYWDVAVLGAETVKKWREEGVNSNSVGGDSLQMELNQPVKPVLGKLFDEVMLYKDGYQTPYAVIHSNIGSFGAAVCLPIICYFAFQSDKPAKLYKAVVDSFGGQFPGIYETNKLERQIAFFYPFLRKQIYKIAKENNIKIDTPFSRLLIISQKENSDDINPILKNYGVYLTKIHAGAKLNNVNLEKHFCLPGNLKYRSHLMGGLLPPLVEFYDGTWPLHQMVKNYFSKGSISLEEKGEWHDISKNILDRWNLFQRAISTR